MSMAGRSPYRVVLFAAAVAVTILTVDRLWGVLFTAFLAVTFGLLLDVPVSALARRRVPRSAATTLTLFAVIGVLVGAGLLIGPATAAQYDRLQDEHGDLGVALVTHANDVLADLPGSPGPLPVDSVAEVDLAGYFGNAAATGAEVATIVLVALFAAVWGVANPQSLADRLLGFVPPARRDRVRAVTGAVEKRLRAWLAGQLTLCVAVGVASYLVFRALDVPFALLFAVLAGVLEAVPAIGIFLASVAPVAITILDDPSRALWLAAAIFIIQELENRLLVPSVMGRAVEIPQALLLLILFAFGTFFGPAGLIVAVPLTAAAFTIHDELTRYDRTHPDLADPADHAGEPPPGPETRAAG